MDRARGKDARWGGLNYDRDMNVLELSPPKGYRKAGCFDVRISFFISLGSLLAGWGEIC